MWESLAGPTHFSPRDVASRLGSQAVPWGLRKSGEGRGSHCSFRPPGHTHHAYRTTHTPLECDHPHTHTPFVLVTGWASSSSSFSYDSDAAGKQRENSRDHSCPVGAPQHCGSSQVSEVPPGPQITIGEGVFILRTQGPVVIRVLIAAAIWWRRSGVQQGSTAPLPLAEKVRESRGRAVLPWESCSCPRLESFS